MDLMLRLMQIAALFVAGGCHALLGSVKIPLARRLSMDEARVGGLVSVFGFTMIPVVLATGFLVDHVGPHAVLTFGFLFLIASLLLLSSAKVYQTALVSVLLLGTGWSALVNVLNVLQYPAFGHTKVYAMNMGDFIFGMGAFVAPLAIAWLLRRIGFSKTLVSFAVLVVVPVLLALGVDWEALKLAAQEGGATAADLFQNPILWICSAAFFFHVPVEVSTATWATTLMEDRGVDDVKASVFLAFFWLCFMGARLTAALTVPEGNEALLILLMACAIAAIMLGLIYSRSAVVTIALVLGAGIILGPIFPTLIAVLLDNIEDPLHGRAVGVFFSIGGIGWATIPILVGRRAKRTSVQQGFLVAFGSALGLTIMALVLLWYMGARTR